MSSRLGLAHEGLGNCTLCRRPKKRSGRLPDLERMKEGRIHPKFLLIMKAKQKPASGKEAKGVGENLEGGEAKEGGAAREGDGEKMLKPHEPQPVTNQQTRRKKLLLKSLLCKNRTIFSTQLFMHAYSFPTYAGPAIDKAIPRGEQRGCAGTCHNLQA